MTPLLDSHPRLRELGVEFGPEGPLAILHLRETAKGGEITMSYLSLAHSAFIAHDLTQPKRRVARAKRIVERAFQLGVFAEFAEETGSFRVKFAENSDGISADFNPEFRANSADSLSRAVSTPPPNVPTAISDKKKELPTTSSEDNNGGEEQDVVVLPFSSEAIALCETLADLIAENGSKRPTVTKRWLSSARLLLGKDDRPYDEVLRVLRWSQRDEFWRSNILSMPKFREKYDRLRLRSQQSGQPGGHLRSVADRVEDDIAEYQRLADEARRREQQDGGAA